MFRRSFFRISFSLFWLGEFLGIASLDAVAAALLSGTDRNDDTERDEKNAPNGSSSSLRVRWEPNENTTWTWFERHEQMDGSWKRTGITTPINKKTGKRYKSSAEKEYLPDTLVPEDVKERAAQLRKIFSQAHADPERRARHGRPPSKWLRSLKANEIRIWLRTITVPEFGVDGMTFFTHLTRDHSFAPENVKDLTVAEQAKLHAAAHYGY